MKYLAVVSALVLFAACSDSPDSPGGTLPVVQNCRIMETESSGDTVVVAWDSLTVEVDGYRIWFADTDPGDWSIIAQVEGTTTQHIATSTGYYCVDAIKGIDVSEEQSNKANDRASFYLLSDTLTVGAVNGIRFEDAQTTTGDATSADFAQDLYIAKSGDTILMYRARDYHRHGKRALRVLSISAPSPWQTFRQQNSLHLLHHTLPFVIVPEGFRLLLLPTLYQILKYAQMRMLLKCATGVAFSRTLGQNYVEAFGKVWYKLLTCAGA